MLWLKVCYNVTPILLDDLPVERPHKGVLDTYRPHSFLRSVLEEGDGLWGQKNCVAPQGELIPQVYTAEAL